MTTLDHRPGAAGGEEFTADDPAAAREKLGVSTPPSDARQEAAEEYAASVVDGIHSRIDREGRKEDDRAAAERYARSQLDIINQKLDAEEATAAGAEPPQLSDDAYRASLKARTDKWLADQAAGEQKFNADQAAAQKDWYATNGVTPPPERSDQELGAMPRDKWEDEQQAKRAAWEKGQSNTQADWEARQFVAHRDTTAEAQKRAPLPPNGEPGTADYARNITHSGQLQEARNHRNQMPAADEIVAGAITEPIPVVGAEGGQTKRKLRHRLGHALRSIGRARGRGKRAK
jgi:hypothetical protein